MADMHKNALCRAQKTIISHPADAHGDVLPMSPQQLFPSGGLDLHTLKGPRFRWPSFFARCPANLPSPLVSINLDIHIGSCKFKYRIVSI